MEENVIVNYTQEDINEIICELNHLYSDLTSSLVKTWLYSIGCVNNCLLKEVFLYRWVLDTQLNEDLLTNEELNNIIFRIKSLINNCQC